MVMERDENEDHCESESFELIDEIAEEHRGSAEMPNIGTIQWQIKGGCNPVGRTTKGWDKMEVERYAGPAATMSKITGAHSPGTLLKPDKRPAF